MKTVFMTNPSLLLFCVTNVICVLGTVHGARWPTIEQEALDESNDGKILKAVQQSMSEWKLKNSFKHRRKRADKTVCYSDLGCFEDSGPFGYLDMLPSPPEEIGTKFYIYSTKNRSDRPLLQFSFVNVTGAWGELEARSLNNSTGSDEVIEEVVRPTLNLTALEDLKNVSVRVIVHGFGSGCIHVWIYEMRTALMAVEDCVILCVDWENGASLPNYVRAAANTRLVGKQLSMLLNGLKDHKNLDLSRTHIIGFSLGAHVAGFAGSDLKGLHRITGLDPAGPLFESQHPKARLDDSDAEFVDVIHSNGENLILGGLGSFQPMGHVDFYPNGGRVQSGCSNIFLGALTDFIWTSTAAVEGRSLCNHRRAYKFFIDSVAPRCLFPAFPCDNYDNFLQGRCFPCDKARDHTDNESQCGNMGYYADRSTGRGQLYLLTREEEPFCAHQYNVEIHSAFSDLPLRTLGRLELTVEGESGLNESFTITLKDDTELFAGEIISRIIVPHPALGFPAAVTVTYKSYSGWLSKGLPAWKIYKVMLTDSFGKHSSKCKKYFTLESGTSIRLPLQTGECNIADENNHFELLGYPEKNTNQSHSNDRLIDRSRIIGPVYLTDEIDDSYESNSSLFNAGNATEELSNLPWAPQLSENSLEREAQDESRSLDSLPVGEIFEPVLKITGKRSGSSFREAHALKSVKTEGEISEPILRSTTPRIKETNLDDSDKRSFSNDRLSGMGSSAITVQLFPFRIGEILDRAERYARLTLLPLITEQAPKFFGFDNSASSVKETAKYFSDLIDETEIDEIERKTKKRDNIQETGNYENESTSPRNIFEPMRENNTKVIQQRSIPQNQIYYTSADDLGDDDDEMKVIKISLPTYKPFAFPYPFELPTAMNDNDDDDDNDVAVEDLLENKNDSSTTDNSNDSVDETR